MGLPQTRVSILIALFIIMFFAVKLLFSEYPVLIVQQANSSHIQMGHGVPLPVGKHLL